MKNRLKQIRKELSLTQHEFADRLGISRNNIATYETGKSEPGDAVVSLVCREFNVNETWLRTGNGEMFIESDEISLDEFAKKKNLTSLEYDIIKAFINMEPDIRHYIVDNFKEIFKKHDNDETAATEDDDIEAELAAYRKELEAEKREQSVLQSTAESSKTKNELPLKRISS